jgi:hypothetical protein
VCWRYDLSWFQMMVSDQGLLHIKLVQRAYELSDAVGTLTRQDHLPEVAALLETLTGTTSLLNSLKPMYA